MVAGVHVHPVAGTFGKLLEGGLGMVVIAFQDIFDVFRVCGDYARMIQCVFQFLVNGGLLQASTFRYTAFAFREYLGAWGC